MRTLISTPERPGQICRIIRQAEPDEQEDVFIITEDPSSLNNEDIIHVTGLRELQRKISDPASATRIPVLKKELIVIAEDLEDYIRSWNRR